MADVDDVKKNFVDCMIKDTFEGSFQKRMIQLTVQKVMFNRITNYI